jgi:hypothetical protein
VSSNPTQKEDRENAQLPQELQFPGNDPPQPTVDSNPEDLESLPHPTELQTNYTTYRCSRETHPELTDAWAFFGKLRERMGWRSEGPIFRTARFWVKRAVPL